MKILIADDSAPVRTALKRCLEMNCSWEVCGEAEDGAQAVQLAEKLSPDVVLLDYGMPSMNGLEAARSIAILNPSAG